MAKYSQMDFKNLSTIPIDVRRIILQEQQKEKEKRGVAKYSVQNTIIKIIRQWANKCKEE